jgi:RHS repeat-associated protein
MMPYYADAI